MGSVMDYVACPQCGGTMFTDYYYKSCEEYWVCKRCGKHGKSKRQTAHDGAFT